MTHNRTKARASKQLIRAELGSAVRMERDLEHLIDDDADTDSFESAPGPTVWSLRNSEGFVIAQKSAFPSMLGAVSGQ